MPRPIRRLPLALFPSTPARSASGTPAQSLPRILHGPATPRRLWARALAIRTALALASLPVVSTVSFAQSDAAAPATAGTAGTGSATSATSNTSNTSSTGNTGNTGNTGGASASVGLMVASYPEYPGSRHRQSVIAPLLELRHGRWFLGAVPEATTPYGLGVDLLATPRLRAGLALSSEIRPLRRSSDDSRLSGLDDIDATQRAHLYATLRGRRSVAAANLATDVGGQALGTTMALSWQRVFEPARGLRLTLGPGLLWADGRRQRTVFGIDAEQSLASGLPTYRPGASIASMRLLASAAYQLDAHWQIGGRLSIERLRDGSADSPLVERRTQPFVALYTMYRF